MNIIKSYFGRTYSQQDVLQELKGRVMWFS